ncbi:coproporphyrinogen III oxidase, anaerobic [Jatrophihabitans endophyticus]|uniref:Heme chaperone HemW n=1 Tax=Jatrophihabitans endophyticus TaxID=1206085 RepID=A0A1M5KDR1_9ACTN|nr:radical SAM family heme chaperone HemW [Jatrophihabitans endophyticus]SHG50942.1 coproporphyrinogen III oxidase, anaerobic [Jatrophihabitans endophyticus]
MPALPTGDPAPSNGRLPRAVLDRARGVPFGIYVHVPFCQARCGYCDFNTYTATELGPGVSRLGYTDTVLRELRLAGDVLTDGDALGDRLPPVSTVFFGGGTPTLLPAEHLGAILDEIGERFGLTDDVEVTTEANPETVTPAYLERLRAAGFTRISLGMQSAVPVVLAVLDRRHRAGRPEEAVAEARAAGFEHINLDLIYGAPHETDADWQASLAAAVAARPDHVSAYALVVEEGTALARQVAQGIVPAPDDDVLADRYVMADEALRAAGYDWYEISNWARGDDARCRHNDLYWTGSNWWGLGPGAHSHVGGVRWWNVKHPVRYSALIDAGQSPAAGRETLDDESQLLERVMLGVRRREGLSVLSLPERSRAVVPQLASWGLVDRFGMDGGRIVLTQRGRLMADAVVKELLVA